MFQKERTTNSHADRDFSVDRPDPDQDKALTKADKELRRRGERERERRDERERKDRDDRDVENDVSRDYNNNMQRFPFKRKSARRDDREVENDVKDGIENSGARPVSSSCDDKSALKSKSIFFL